MERAFMIQEAVMYVIDIWIWIEWDGIGWDGCDRCEQSWRILNWIVLLYNNFQYFDNSNWIEKNIWGRAHMRRQARIHAKEQEFLKRREAFVEVVEDDS